MNDGLSPYDNNITHSPPVWDGINDYEHSRFLYPPLVANLFQPITFIPYFYAKIFWSLFSLLSIGLALYTAYQIVFPGTPVQVLLLGICVCWYYPLLTHLERGQIDAVTLLLLSLAIYFLVKPDKKQETLSGIFLAIATLLKLHSVYLLPFFIARKHWQALKGFAIAAFVISIAGVATENGRILLKAYLIDELPRITDYGQTDHGDVLLDARTIQDMIKDLPNGYTIKNGYLYRPVLLSFVSNATLVRPIRDRLLLSGLELNFAVISLAVFGLFFLLLLLWRYYFYPAEKPEPEKEFLYWQAVLVIVLLSAPLTHVMNTVWMLPVLIMLISGFSNLHTVTQKLGYATMVSGILLVGMTNSFYSHLLFPMTVHWMDDKYLIGEMLFLIGCLLFLSERPARTLKN